LDARPFVGFGVLQIFGNLGAHNCEVGLGSIRRARN
jgi:hypothetical protein